MTRVVVDDAVAAAGLAYGEVEECEIPHAVLGLAAAGYGVGVVSDQPRFGASPVLLRRPGGQAVTVPLYAAWDPDHYAADTLRDLALRLSQFAVPALGAALAPHA